MDYFVKVEWDDETHVWYVCDSNVPGLVTEAETVEEMFVKLKAMVPEMLEENGMGDSIEIPFYLHAERRFITHRSHC